MFAMIQDAEIQIGQLSRRTSCNIETVRHFERIGLLAALVRSAGRYRIYGADDVGRLAFIRRARELGFTLDDVRALLALSVSNGQESFAEARELAARHVKEIRTKIADLQAMERILTNAVQRCASGGLPSCPIIDAISHRT
jgi:MerR family mercuric resistance operon transcriptional regulator